MAQQSPSLRPDIVRTTTKLRYFNSFRGKPAITTFD